MEKSSLKLHEYYTLDVELNGVVNQQTGAKTSDGLLGEKLKLTTKYWLTDLAKKVTTEKEAIEAAKTELIKKFGTADEQGNISIPVYINEVKNEEGQVVSREVNPNFVEFQKDFDALLQEDKELEHKGFKLEDFENVESSDNYVTFFKLIKVDE